MLQSLPMSVWYANEHGKQILTTIDVLDVDFIENEGKKFVYHVGDVKYYQILNKGELEELLEEEHGFDSLDRSNLVNMKKIKYYDQKLGKVYFVSNPDKKSKFAVIARIKQDFVEKFIKRIVNFNQDTTEVTKVESPTTKMGLLKGYYTK